MPLYRVTMEFEAYVWSDSTRTMTVEREVEEEYGHDITSDQYPRDALISASRVTSIKEVAPHWQDAEPYGVDDGRTIRALLEEEPAEPEPDTKTLPMKCAHGHVLGHVLGTCVACRPMSGE